MMKVDVAGMIRSWSRMWNIKRTRGGVETAIRVENGQKPAARFIGESKLSAMILFGACVSAPGIEAVHLAYEEPEQSGGPNWRLTGISYGKADHALARQIVETAAFMYRLHWIMVPDDDQRAESGA